MPPRAQKPPRINDPGGLVLRFLAFAALPLVIMGAGEVHAQSVSRAIPPDAASVQTQASNPSNSRMSSRPALKPAASSVRLASSEPLLALHGMRSSAALPPEELAAQARPAVQPAAAEIKPSVVAATVQRIADVSDGEEPVARRASPVRADVDGDVRCVAQAVYHEARGESLQGQRAVADVVMNRARSGRWGAGACAVVNAPSQFSGRWSWRAPQIGVAAWDRAIAIARDAVSGAVSVSSRLMNFRASYMGSRGARAMRIGNHVFW